MASGAGEAIIAHPPDHTFPKFKHPHIDQVTVAVVLEGKKLVLINKSRRSPLLSRPSKFHSFSIFPNSDPPLISISFPHGLGRNHNAYNPKDLDEEEDDEEESGGSNHASANLSNVARKSTDPLTSVYRSGESTEAQPRWHLGSQPARSWWCGAEAGKGVEVDGRV